MRNSPTLLSLVAAFVLWSPAAAEAQSPLVDPGTGPWTPVAANQLEDVCRLDPALLEQVTMRQNMSFAVVRYGRLCFVSGENGSDGPGVSHVFSTTKTLAALLTGSVMYQTRSLPQSSSPMTGPLSEFDRMD
jgi:hypothetical protein